MAGPMIAADWETLASYLRARADELGLRDWTLLVKHDPPSDPSVLAEIRPVEGRKHATVRVCVEFRELTDDEQRHVIVHELLHCHLAEVQHLTHPGSQIGGMLGGNGAGILDAVRLAIEYAVDGIADAIDPGFPSIVWETTDPTREESVNAPWEGSLDSRTPS